jgi:hypothetical protein
MKGKTMQQSLEIQKGEKMYSAKPKKRVSNQITQKQAAKELYIQLKKGDMSREEIISFLKIRGLPRRGGAVSDLYIRSMISIGRCQCGDRTKPYVARSKKTEKELHSRQTRHQMARETIKSLGLTPNTEQAILDELDLRGV